MIYLIEIDSTAHPEAERVKREGRQRMLDGQVFTGAYTYKLHHPSGYYYYGSTDCVTHRRNGHHDKAWHQSSDDAAVHMAMREWQVGWTMTVLDRFDTLAEARQAEAELVRNSATETNRFLCNQTDPLTRQILNTPSGLFLRQKLSVIARERAASPETRAKHAASVKAAWAAKRLAKRLSALAALADV